MFSYSYQSDSDTKNLDNIRVSYTMETTKQGIEHSHRCANHNGDSVVQSENDG